ncbi:MAG: hypothetical protein FJ290_21020 [Planctomycetes bacterium]|nr:hypothetical protein [Planctomycetota bacterium]
MGARLSRRTRAALAIVAICLCVGGVVLGLYAWRARPVRPDLPPLIEEKPGQAITTFFAKVRAVVMTSQFAGDAIVVDPFAGNWVVTMEVIRVRQGGAVKAGQTVSFIIHSPARDLCLTDHGPSGPTWFCFAVANREGIEVRSLHPAWLVDPVCRPEAWK